ncbi:MAG TPA: DUF2520 domain-containing protein [Bacteroidales bacterium]|nr:DUF2520 domain-containing protein [Bacteroidales bacterium]
MAINSAVLIGAGRVATQLGRVLKLNGIIIVQVYSRTQASATELAKKLGCQAASGSEKISPGVDLYIISISDDAISEVAKKLNFSDSIVVHTSGSVDLDVLKTTSGKTGVFYPLNTFSKNRETDLKKTPICVEAVDKQTESELAALGQLISDDVRIINSEQRSNIHLAAVFASNFTNFMMVNAAEILDKAGVSFDILMPLVEETISKLKIISPRDAQTGPALRNDVSILKKHLNMLGNDPARQMIYDVLSGQIKEFFKGNQ